MQSLIVSFVSALCVVGGVAAGPLPSDYDFDYQYPDDVIIIPPQYDIKGGPEADFYPDYPVVEGSPYDYVVVLDDGTDLPDDDYGVDAEYDEDDDDEEEEDDDSADSPPGAEDDEGSPAPKSRQRRQSGSFLDLSLNSPNADGSRRPLYLPRVNAYGSGHYRDRNNYGLGYSFDAGALLYRSRDGRHSFGASVGTSGYDGRYGGRRFTQSPFDDVRFGLGYTFRFR